MTENEKNRVRRILEELEKLENELRDLLGRDSSDTNGGTVEETKLSSADDEEKVIFEEITDFLLSIGMPSHIKGFHYVRYAIQLAVQDFTITGAITKQLYPAVAKRFETTNSRAERAIRHAIESIWARGDVAKYEEVLGKSINLYDGKPTNSEFVASVADHIRLKHGRI